jgi:tRNA threonylcarbamoyladenosine biosynthesis protein TsaB
MLLSLCITSDYDQLHIALVQDGTLLHAVHANKHDGNKTLVPAIVQLLNEQHASLEQIKYIAVNVGPAPYTSLRIVLSTMNGIAYATGIPLVEVDALRAYHQQYGNVAPITVALLNAFNNELFYAIEARGNYMSGYASIGHLIAQLAQTYPHEPILFYGNGFGLHKEAIIAQLGDYAQYDATIAAYPQLELLVQTGHEQWLQGTTTAQAHPRYLKELAYQNSVKIG